MSTVEKKEKKRKTIEIVFAYVFYIIQCRIFILCCNNHFIVFICLLTRENREIFSNTSKLSSFDSGNKETIVIFIVISNKLSGITFHFHRLLEANVTNF